MLFYLFMLTAQADEGEEGKITYKKQTEIDFEAIELEGELVKPQGALLLERKRAAFNPLITLRKDFNKEMKESIKAVE